MLLGQRGKQLLPEGNLQVHLLPMITNHAAHPRVCWECCYGTCQRPYKLRLNSSRSPSKTLPPLLSLQIHSFFWFGYQFYLNFQHKVKSECPISSLWPFPVCDTHGFAWERGSWRKINRHRERQRHKKAFFCVGKRSWDSRYSNGWWCPFY